MAGYSGTPLTKKLGIKPAHRVALIQAPANFETTLGALPEGVHMTRGARGTRPFDVILLFTMAGADFAARFLPLSKKLDPAGGLWVAWPKRASKVPTDMTEDVVRDHALAMGLVDNKVCAIDEVWSGLRLVVRLKDRPRR